MTEQILMFKDMEWWKEEWQDMPEYIQEDLTSFRKIVIHFRDQDDVDSFAELIGQSLTPKQISTWFPYLPPTICSDKRYVDES